MLVKLTPSCFFEEFLSSNITNLTHYCSQNEIVKEIFKYLLIKNVIEKATGVFYIMNRAAIKACFKLQFTEKELNSFG
jgi:hypothetical protein